MNNIKTYLYNLATDSSSGLIASIAKFFLFLLSLVYGLIVVILIFLSRFKPYKPSCKVISVGNITLGGTGKTSLVEYIALYLAKQGHKVAVISRGYKRKPAGKDTKDYKFMGDEPYMLSKKLGNIPVIVDKKRIRAIKLAIKNYNADTVLLDDAFQQWRIRKDLEILAIDAANPFGNKNLIPRGILREPVSSLKRADIFVITKTNLSKDAGDIKGVINRYNRDAQIVESMHAPVSFFKLNNSNASFNLDSLRGRSVTLFSGIGDPDSFEKLISSLGINIGLSFKFADHHDYAKEDLNKIITSSKEKNIETIITTEKDAVRIKDLKFIDQGLQFFFLRIELRIEDEERFNNRLLRIYSL